MSDPFTIGNVREMSTKELTPRCIFLYRNLVTYTVSSETYKHISQQLKKGRSELYKRTLDKNK